ncbi:hypothetical protein [Sporomusa aerivorans]|uniref:hypothetical protein n=1 Tax=Sporomusa aerivorans TaxID=204936 RepID=UPI00352BBA39
MGLYRILPVGNSVIAGKVLPIGAGSTLLYSAVCQAVIIAAQYIDLVRPGFKTVFGWCLEDR